MVGIVGTIRCEVNPTRISTVGMWAACLRRFSRWRDVERWVITFSPVVLVRAFSEFPRARAVRGAFTRCIVAPKQAPERIARTADTKVDGMTLSKSKYPMS